MTAPGRSPWSAPIVLASIAIGVIILAVSIGVGLVVSKPSHQSDNSEPAVSTVTVTTTTSSEPAVTTSTATTTSTAPSSSGMPGAIAFQQPAVPNTDQHGFTDGGPRCNVAGDPVAMVVVTTRSQAIICQVGRTLGLYYKGSADGRGVTIDYPTRQDDGWVVAAHDGTTYMMSPGGFTILANDGKTYEEPVTYYWSQ